MSSDIRIQDMVIGIILFAVVLIGLFTVSLQLYSEDSIHVTINNSYMMGDTGVYNEITNLSQNIADKAPGGFDSQKLADSSSIISTGYMGLSVMSLIWAIPTIVKDTLFGSHSEDNITKEGIISTFSINPIFGYALISAFIIIIAIILVSSVLQNRW